jgi:hypothetical protein
VIYEVTLQMPAINEVVTLAADSMKEAVQQAMLSAFNRAIADGNATVTAVPAAVPE